MNKKLAALGGIAVAAVVALAGCAPAEQATPTETSTVEPLTGSVVADGSSTVAPLTEAAADLYRDVEPGVNVTVATSGTGGGFKKFCAGETDISNASRPIKQEEIDLCAGAGIEYTEIVIANDGLAVVVNMENDWLQCITTEELNRIWAPESEGVVMTWADVNPAWPAEPLALFGAGTDSGTFDYFTGAINGEEGAIRIDYSPSEDDNITIAGVSGAKGGMGFFGLSYVIENEGVIRALEVNSGAGCVAPSEATVQDGTYNPLGRPLFIYVNNASYAENAAVQSFVDYYVENEAEVADEALFIGLTADQKATAQSELATLK